MSLLHLIYVSSLGADVQESEIVKILASSVRRNGEAGVTGMLLYAGGNFLQVLEGERAAVEETYARIARDPRHHGLIEIERRAVAQRDFPAWSMGFRHLGAAEVAKVPHAAPLFEVRDPSVIRANPGVALEMLREFAAGNR